MDPPPLKKLKISQNKSSKKFESEKKRHSHLIFKEELNRDVINTGTLVVIVVGREELRQIYITPNEKFNCRQGFYQHDDFIGKRFGEKVFGRGKSGRKGFVIPLRPDPVLHTESLRHRTQILYGLDISIVLLSLDLSPGKVVVEAGTGSGGMSTALSQCVQPNGQVHTFEYHEGRFEAAKKEFMENGLSEIIRSYHGDVCKFGFPRNIILDESVDAVFLDLPSPSLCVKEVQRVLKKGGRFCSFSPCIEQVMETCESLHDEENCFDEIETHEYVLSKFYKQNTQVKSTNPEKSNNNTNFEVIVGESVVNGHTAYLTFATKL